MRFAVRDRDRYLLVRAADLDWVESAANYVRLSTRGHDYLLRGTLAEMERRLDPARLHAHPPLDHREHLAHPGDQARRARRLRRRADRRTHAPHEPELPRAPARPTTHPVT